MPIKIYKPTSAGRRSKASVVSSHDLTRKEPEKSLLMTIKNRAGRSHGTITIRHRGGRTRRRYRIIDFMRTRYDEPATVHAIEYDPNRNARIALVAYPDGAKSYIIAPLTLEIGMQVISSRKKIEARVGNRMPLEYIPTGIGVYDVELTPGSGGKLVRAAGTLAVVQAIEGEYAQLKMPSSEVRLVKCTCAATIGQVSNPDVRLVRWGKAGRMRHKGRRPSVRGKVMNPVDHPHGGGEGLQPIGLKYPKTKWGRPALGVKTRKKRSSDRLILQRRKKK